MPFQKRLIVNADDFGLHRSINSAIAQAHQKGIVTSASLMPGPHIAPAFDHAIDTIRELPTLDVGLHFTLVGAPGQPEDYVAFLQSKLVGDFPSSAVKSTLKFQLDTVLEKGVSITHIDSHQHLHAIPSIMRVVAEVAKEYGIPAVRFPAEDMEIVGASAKRRYSAKILTFLCSLGQKELDKNNIKYTDHFAGMAISGSLTPKKLIQMVNRLQPGVTEIVCHPGADNISLAENYSWGYDWLSEFISVTDPTVRQAITDQQVELTSFAAMVKT